MSEVDNDINDEINANAREGGDDALSSSLKDSIVPKETNDASSPPLGPPVPERTGAEGLPERLLIYNITTQVSWQVHEAWLAWMLDIYIPQIIGTGCFVKHQLVRVLETDEADGPVYAVQYYALSRTLHSEYMMLYEAGFKAQEHERWGNKIFSFASLMQVVN